MPEVKIYDENVDLIDTVDVDFIDIYVNGATVYLADIDSEDEIYDVDKYEIKLSDKMKILEVYY